MSLEQGNPVTARACLEESVAMSDSWGERPPETLHQLGIVLRHQGEHARARSILEEALAIARRDGATRTIARIAFTLGTVAYVQGDLEAARSAYQQSFALFHELGDSADIAEHLVILAKHAAQGEQPTRAPQLFGAAAGGDPLEHVAIDDPTAAPIRASLADPRLAATSAEGRATALEQAIVAALGDEW